MNIRLMIADDHVAIRAGVISLIQGTEIEMICQAETCEDTVKFALTCQPDVLLLDIRLADSDGLIALERIKLENSEIAVIIFSAVEEVKEMAKHGSNEALLDKIEKDHPNQHVETKRPMRFSPEHSARKIIDKAIAMCMAIEECGRDEALERICELYVEDFKYEYDQKHSKTVVRPAVVQ